MHLGLVDYVLWYSVPFVLAGVLAAMYRRGIHRLYPYFFVYVIAQVLSVPILAVMARLSQTAYYYSYYVDLILTIVLSAAVIWNITRRLFVRRPLRPWTSMFLYLCVAITLIAVTGFAMNHSTGIRNGTVSHWVSLSDRLLRMTQVLLAVVIILIGRHFGIPRRSFVFGLIFGFGIFALVNTVAFNVLSHQGAIGDITLSRVNGLMYLFVCFVWLYYSIFGSQDRQWSDGNGSPASAFRDAREPVMKNRWFFRAAYGGAGLDR